MQNMKGEMKYGSHFQKLEAVVKIMWEKKKKSRFLNQMLKKKTSTLKSARLRKKQRSVDRAFKMKCRERIKVRYLKVD